MAAKGIEKPGGGVGSRYAPDAMERIRQTPLRRLNGIGERRTFMKPVEHVNQIGARSPADVRIRFNERGLEQRHLALMPEQIQRKVRRLALALKKVRGQASTAQKHRRSALLANTLHSHLSIVEGGDLHTGKQLRIPPTYCNEGHLPHDVGEGFDGSRFCDILAAGTAKRHVQNRRPLERIMIQEIGNSPDRRRSAYDSHLNRIGNDMLGRIRGKQMFELGMHRIRWYRKYIGDDPVAGYDVRSTQREGKGFDCLRSTNIGVESARQARVKCVDEKWSKRGTRTGIRIHRRACR